MEIFESGEMYLETILKIYKNKGSVRSVDIVNEMGFAKSSVSQAMKILAQKEYIVNNGVNIILTEKGLSLAEKIYERHNILTNFLMLLGVDEETAVSDACRIEHVIGDETFSAVKNFLNENSKKSLK